MTPNSYIKIYDRFKQFCIDIFGDNDYKIIYELYSKILLFKFQSTYDSNGKLVKNSFKNTRDSLFNSRVQNINSLIKDESGNIDKNLKAKLLAAAEFTLNQHKIGNLPDKFKHISSFTNFAKNFNMDRKDKEITEKNKICTPSKYKKVREDFDDDFYNWDYKCSECNEVFDAWTTECRCGAVIDWRNRTE